MGVHPMLIAFYRFFFAAAFSIFYIIFRGEARSLSLLWQKPLHIGFLAFTGIFGMGSAVFLALDRSTAVDVSIIMNSNPIFITPLAILIGESFTLRKSAGVIIGLLGCAIVVNGAVTGFNLIQRENFAGNMIALGASICWAVYTVAGKQLVRERGGLIVTSLNMLVGSIPLFLLVLAVGEFTFPPLKAFLIIICLAIFPTSIGFVLWYKALEDLDASRLGPLQYLVPIGTAIISFFLLDEGMKWATIVGMLLVFLGIYLSTASAQDQTA
jgi:drug/metabolite transporter (DMT)-like permease